MTRPSRLHAFFGKEVSRARTAAGLSQEELAAKVFYSRGNVGMIEIGRRLSTKDVISRIDDALNQEGRLLRLWAEARLESASAIIADLLEVEARATYIREYHPVLVPGLLQTEGYMRALFGAALFSGADASEIDGQVTQRLSRHDMFTGENPLHYTCILDESVIMRVIGSDDVMRDQLNHLLAAMRRRGTTIQIMPCSAGAFPASGPIMILDVDGSHVVHLEGPISSGLTTSEPSIIQESVEQFDLLRAQALPLADSVRMIEKRIEELQP